jgi:hypothetical protein
MKKILTMEEFDVKVLQEKFEHPDKVDTKGYGNLQFDCGCGSQHGVNEFGIEKVARLRKGMKWKVLFKCPTNFTAVTIKGMFKQKCISEWTSEVSLIEDYVKEVGL